MAVKDEHSCDQGRRRKWNRDADRLRIGTEAEIRSLRCVSVSKLRAVLAILPPKDVAKALDVPIEYLDFWLSGPDDVIEFTMETAADLRGLWQIIQTRADHLWQPEETLLWWGTPGIPELDNLSPKQMFRVDRRRIVLTIESKWRIRYIQGKPTGILTTLELRDGTGGGNLTPAAWANLRIPRGHAPGGPRRRRPGRH